MRSNAANQTASGTRSKMRISKTCYSLKKMSSSSRTEYSEDSG